jgi:hypothetical protein
VALSGLGEACRNQADVTTAAEGVSQHQLLVSPASSCGTLVQAHLQQRCSAPGMFSEFESAPCNCIAEERAHTARQACAHLSLQCFPARHSITHCVTHTQHVYHCTAWDSICC